MLELASLLSFNTGVRDYFRFSVLADSCLPGIITSYLSLR